MSFRMNLLSPSSELHPEVEMPIYAVQVMTSVRFFGNIAIPVKIFGRLCAKCEQDDLCCPSVVVFGLLVGFNFQLLPWTGRGGGVKYNIT